MPVDPFLVPLLPTLPPFPDAIDDWDTHRSQGNAAGDVLVEQLMDPGPEVRERRTITLPVQDGHIDLNLYVPDGDGPHPAHLYLHGGGWIEGDIHTKAIDVICRERAVGAGCIVVAVNYRKAPQYPFPIPLEDCYAALVWLADHTDELRVRRDNVSVGGASAGGNLAAAVALKARDEGGPAIVLQLLELPALDLTLSSPSLETNATGYGLTTAATRKCLDYYLASPEDAKNPYASPLLAPDLSGLPPAYIMSAEYDPLRDDGERYAQRLREAGVPVTYVLVRGHIHGSHAFTKPMASARAYTDDLIGALREAHTRAATTS